MSHISFFFFFNHTPPTEIYTLSLHDLFRSVPPRNMREVSSRPRWTPWSRSVPPARSPTSMRDRSRRSEEHTSELQSHSELVCRLLLEKKKTDKDDRDRRGDI